MSRSARRVRREVSASGIGGIIPERRGWVPHFCRALCGRSGDLSPCNVSIPAIKMAPFGATFQEAKWVGNVSGKAKCDAVPPARTAMKEVTLLVESEGHFA